MNMAVELHDSRVLAVERCDDGNGYALLHGVVYRSAGIPGHDAQVSGWQNVRLRFTGMKVIGEIGDAGDWIYDGTLAATGYANEGFFVIPLSLSGSVELKMNLGDDYHSLTLSGDSLSVEVEGEFEAEAEWDAFGNRVSVS